MKQWFFLMLLLLLLTLSLLTVAVGCNDDDDDDDDKGGDDDDDDNPFDDDDDNNSNESIKAQCLEFFADCYGVSESDAETYCSFMDQYIGLGECYEDAVSDYMSCYFDEFDCANPDPNDVMDCSETFSEELIDCASAADDDDNDDDDNNDDDDSNDDDDDNDDDDATDDDDYTGADCFDLASEGVTCGLQMQDADGNILDFAGIEAMCEFFSDGYNGFSPFFECLYNALLTCDSYALDECSFPDPYGGCSNSVAAMSDCGMALQVQNPNNSVKYSYPILDLMDQCSSIAGFWSCIQGCVDKQDECTGSTDDYYTLSACVGATGDDCWQYLG